MKKWLTYALGIAAVVLICIGTGLVMHSASRHKATLTCTGLDVQFADSLKFVGAEDVDGYITKYYGAYVGQQLDSVGLDRIEKILASRSAISGCEAWTTGDGVLHVSISQRKPAVRFSNGNTGFYVDGQGYIFPLHKDFTAAVPVVSGDIPVRVAGDYKGFPESEEDAAWIKGIIELVDAFSSSKVWKDRVSGYSVDVKGEIRIKMKDAPETFIFGKADEVREKMGRMEKYYGSILPACPDKGYRSVNVKYNNQIICRKDI